jgi:trans-aconitate methyltransferase
MKSDWATLVAHYEHCFHRHGANPRGVDWPNGIDLEARFATLLSILERTPNKPLPVVLDVGCGPGLLLDYLRATGRLEEVEYRGVDLSTVMVEAARQRWPDKDFSTRDIIAQPLAPQSVDVVVINGVLTEKLDLAHDVMVGLAQQLVLAAFTTARVGVAFNVMNHHVDRQRPDLFHWAFDDVAAFLTARVSRHYALRANYGLYEYAVFVWREPQRPPMVSHTWWER